MDIKQTGKPWWKSRAIWSGVITVFASIGALFGIAIPQDLVLGAIMSIVTGIGGLGAIVGRVQATQPIETKKTKTTGEL